MLKYKGNKFPTPRGVPKKSSFFLLTFNGQFGILIKQLARKL